jgi:hypothetical protein
MSNKQEQPQQINLEIELTEEVAQGNYSNFAIISHSKSEFLIDFTRILPGIPKAKVVSRIIMTPEHAKLLLSALTQNIIKFENNNGEIVLNEDSGPMMDMGQNSTIN